MNTAQRIIKNMGFMGVSQIVITFLGFILTIYLARYLGEAGFGEYNFALYFTALFIPLADLGISQFMIRELAREEGKFDKFIVNALLIKIPLAILTLIIIILVINLMGYPTEVKNLVLLFGIYMIFSSFVLTFRSIFQAFEKLEYTSILIIIEKALLIPLILLFISLGMYLIGVSYAYIISIIFTFLIGAYLLMSRIKKPKIEFDFEIWKLFLRKALPFGLNSLFTVSFIRVDTVILSYLQNDVAVGIYNAAYAPMLALTSAFANIVVYSVYPIMSRYFISSRESLKKSTVLTCKYMVIFCFPIAVICFVIPGKFVNLFYGSQYSQAIVAFQILALFIPLRLVSSITGTLLTSINRQDMRSLGYLIGLLINIVINILIIPSLSYVGASIATVLSEVVVYILFIYMIHRYYGSLNLHKNFLKPFIASLIMGTILFFISGLNIFVLVILGFIIYFVLLIILKTFTDEDKFVLKQIIGRYINDR